MFPKETIPDNDLVYRRVHRNSMPYGELNPGCLWTSRNVDQAMSVDWSRYSTAAETRDRVIGQGHLAKDYAIVSFVVGDARNIDHLSVNHDPQTDNRSHSLVDGEKTEKTRLQLYDKLTLEI